MKKDIEWLKEEIKNAVFLKGMTRKEYVLNLINQLEIEPLSPEWIEAKTWNNHYVGDPFVFVEDLQNLIVPKQELPVIPKFVADQLEYWKRNKMNILWQFWLKEIPSSVLWWLEDDNGNWDKLLDAGNNGYEVEEEQKYYVLDSEDIPLLERANNQTCKTTTGLSIYEDGRDNSKFELTEQEIKDYDERFWTFAVPVEEEEE